MTEDLSSWEFVSERSIDLDKLADLIIFVSDNGPFEDGAKKNLSSIIQTYRSNNELTMNPELFHVVLRMTKMILKGYVNWKQGQFEELCGLALDLDQGSLSSDRTKEDIFDSVQKALKCMEGIFINKDLQDGIDIYGDASASQDTRFDASQYGSVTTEKGNQAPIDKDSKSPVEGDDKSGDELKREIELEIKQAQQKGHEVSDWTFEDADTYQSMGRALSTNADFNNSLEHHLESLKRRLNRFGNNHPFVAECYNTIALVFWAKDDLDFQLKLNQLSLSIAVERLKMGLHSLADTFAKLSMLKVNEASVDTVQTASHSLENSLRGEFPDAIINELSCLAGVLKESVVPSIDSLVEKNLKDTVDQYMASLTSGTGDEYLAGIGNLQKHKQQLKGIVMSVREQGVNHIWMISDHLSGLDHLGDAARGENASKDAVTYYKLSLLVKMATIKEVLALISSTCYQVARANRKRDEPADQYLFLSEQLSEMFEKGKMATAKLKDEKGIGLRKDGKLEEALQCHKEASDLIKDALNVQRDSEIDKSVYIHRDYILGVGNNFNNFGLVYLEKGEFKRAKTFFLKGAEIHVELGEDHTMIGYKWINLGNVEMKLGNFDEAYEDFSKALQMFKAKLKDPNHSLLARIHHLLGTALEARAKREFTISQTMKQAKAQK